MKLGIIGPQDSVQEAKSYVNSTGLPVNILELSYERFTEVPQLLQLHQMEVDAILFTGAVPYTYALHYSAPTCFWHVVPKDKLSLAFSLLQAGFIKHYDLTKISIDSYDDLIMETYNELQYSPADIYVAVAPKNIFAKHYLDDVLSFHIKQYKRGKAKCIVTGLEIIYKELTAQNIPCIMVRKVFDTILHELNRVLINGKIVEKNNKFVILSIYVDFLEEHPAFEGNVLHMLNLKNNIKNSIYIFAQNIEAGIFEQSENRYFLCANSEKVLLETENYQKNTLLQTIAKNEIVKNVFIGIGEGQNVSLAQKHATLAEEHARKLGCNCTFVIDAKKKIFGPLVCSDSNQNNTIERDFTTISQQSSVSIQCLNKLYFIIKRYGIDTTTPKQLARLYGGSERNINRILAKLEDAGYVQFLGKEARTSAGRPSKLVKIRLGI